MLYMTKYDSSILKIHEIAYSVFISCPGRQLRIPALCCDLRGGGQKWLLLPGVTDLRYANGQIWEVAKLLISSTTYMYGWYFYVSRLTTLWTRRIGRDSLMHRVDTPRHYYTKHLSYSWRNRQLFDSKVAFVLADNGISTRQLTWQWSDMSLCIPDVWLLLTSSNQTRWIKKVSNCTIITSNGCRSPR